MHQALSALGRGPQQHSPPAQAMVAGRAGGLGPGSRALRRRTGSRRWRRAGALAATITPDRAALGASSARRPWPWAERGPAGRDVMHGLEPLADDRARMWCPMAWRERVHSCVHENDHPAEVCAVAGGGGIAHHDALAPA